MAAVTSVTSSSWSYERRLAEFGLSSELIHTALRPGLTRATNRSAKALRSTPGTDIYNDSMEQFHQLLAEAGWSLAYVDQQPRLVHPEGIIAFTVAAGRNVGKGDVRLKPRTGRKGKATRESLSASLAQVPMLFGAEDAQLKLEVDASARRAPLWLLVHERTSRGLNLELSRPRAMTPGGIVNDWDDQILVGFLDLDGDLSIFDVTDDDGDINVSVEPL